MTSTTPTRVRAAVRGDVRSAAATLAAAFADDPVMAWLFPDEPDRPRQLARLFAIQLRHQHLRHGGVRVETGAGPIRGAALWDPPGRWKNPAWRDLLTLPAFVRLFGSRLSVAGQLVAGYEAVHPATPHWYLAVIGTEPAAQGLGIGAALLRPRLDECDRLGLPAYLESSKERNVGYYERFGFRTTREITVPDGGPTSWAMWRDPTPS